MQNLKRNYMNGLIYKKNRLTDLETELMVAREEGWGEGIVRKFGVDMYTLLYLKLIANEVFLYSTGSSAQCHVPAWNRRGVWGRMDTCVYMCPFAVHLKLSKHC